MTDTSGAARLDEEFFQDPQRLFARLRESAPVTPVIVPGGGRAWLVTRYDDVRAALSDPRLAKDWIKRASPANRTRDPVRLALNRHLLTVDPPDHTRLRRLVVKAFTPGRVAALRPRISEITAGLLDDLPSSGVVDLVEGFAFPLPITVICELLGIPPGDRDRFQKWTAAVLDTMAPEDHEAGAASLHGYFTELIARKRAEPGGDLVSALIAARDSGDALSEDELISMLFLLLVAGHETTVNLIASGVLALLAHPAELARLRDDPSLLPSAVEELLRYANPLNHATGRFTVEPVTIGGVDIPAHDWVVLAIASANTDPARFPGAGALDLGREASGHVAFGHGIHYCLGAPLARLEGEIALGSLLSAYPDLSLAVPESSLRWRPSSLIHGLETLPVRLA
ncbi:MAG: cytochrome P450 [Streptosporangiales bacterium]|nr:cytochrome P450 [Streptosporangiales bacterium]